MWTVSADVNSPLQNKPHGLRRNQDWFQMISADPTRHGWALRKRSALSITDTELKLMVSAAIDGKSSQPVRG
jgi:hypothetical protein